MDIPGRNTLQIVALVRSPELGRDLMAAVNPHNGTAIDVQIGTLKALGPTLARQGKPDALIVDVDPEDADDLAALANLKQLGNGARVPVLATAAAISPVMLRHLLRDCVDDFIPQPVTASNVEDALGTAIAKRGHVDKKPRLARGSIITFMRASGGMGATTLAINTAHALTQVQDGSPARVCLLDLDPQFGNAALCLDLAHGHGMVDIVRSPSRLDGDLLRGAMLQHRSGLHVLTAPNIPMPLDALDPEVTGQIFDVAQSEFDYVIVDLPHCLTNWTEVVLARSAIVALVVQLTVPALRQARRLIDMLQEEGHYALPLCVVLNRYVRKWNDVLGTKEAEKALGRKVDHVVLNDFELVSKALNEGLPATALQRNSKFCRSISEFVEASVAKIRAAETRALAS